MPPSTNAVGIKKTSSNPNRMFTWMGEDKAENSVENVAILRELGGSHKHRYRHREDRERILAETRCYLDLIKRELWAHDVEAQRSGASLSGLPPPPEDNLDAVLSVSGVVRGAVYRKHRQLISAFDGTFHDSPEALQKYNEFCEETLRRIFERKAKLRKELERDPERKSRIPAGDLEQAEDTSRLEIPSSNDFRLTEQEAAVFAAKPVRQQDENQRLREAELRDRYNLRAEESSKHLLSFSLVRNADLQGRYRVVHLTHKSVVSPQSEHLSP